jgi:hypothetical protein
MKRIFGVVLMALSLLMGGNSLSAKNNEYNLENMKINYSEWSVPGSTRVIISWETVTELKSLYISYVSPNGSTEFPINYPDEPFPMPKDLNEANPIQMFMLPPTGKAEAELTNVREKYYYELKLLIGGRVVGTTMFEFRYQLADSEYVNTIYVNNTSYTSSIPKESPTFLDYLFIGFTIAGLISAATYLIMNASEKSIFTEDENEEE